MRIRNKGLVTRNKSLVAAAIATVLGLGTAAYPLATSAMGTNQNHQVMSSRADDYRGSRQYTADIEELNNTGVHGNATFRVIGRSLSVTIHATGLEPGVHPQHIHGKEMAKAECPTSAADTNHDGFVSVIEGAPAYGLIKLNLTNPQTAFGPPVTTALFTPFAGKADSKNFPVVGQDGILNFSNTYNFDSSAAAQGAYESLMPLGDQHIVLHGATAPKSVDADAFAALGHAYPAGTDLSQPTYDSLLPVGCGSIEESAAAKPLPVNHGMNESERNGMMEGQNQGVQGLMDNQANTADARVFNERVTNLSNSFEATVHGATMQYDQQLSDGTNKDVARNQLINGVSSAKDAELNSLTEARNQYIDQLNRSGNVVARDTFLNSFDGAFNHHKEVLEQLKNDL